MSTSWFSPSLFGDTSPDFFDLDEPGHQILVMIELARFADMCNVTGMKASIAQVFDQQPNPESNEIRPTTNAYSLISQHIISATFLPQAHAIRHILVAAIVRGYLLCENHGFSKETRKFPTFRVDLLQEVGLSLKGLKIGQSGATYEDPLNGDECKIYRFYSS
ncbi:uncharacterized protein N7443_009757 [Penicillium atrosanguineum]|uniref:uncharacterized protein n=1 Tax=Penicillium atrosanguineum TaxID=1132637 RepID=UPI002396E81D|nr:uncharacterized protein N7443_009757 [Penicillium atrosanguineum]KAJ5137958.1 hypothetical protein N7526_004191 [Penicillium atrosanguineum]KAJ5289504.1 hypothetical protein N7443_009757 [Penicillium atrosanguineum]